MSLPPRHCHRCSDSINGTLVPGINLPASSEPAGKTTSSASSPARWHRIHPQGWATGGRCESGIGQDLPSSGLHSHTCMAAPSQIPPRLFSRLSKECLSQDFSLTFTELVLHLPTGSVISLTLSHGMRHCILVSSLGYTTTDPEQEHQHSPWTLALGLQPD